MYRLKTIANFSPYTESLVAQTNKVGFFDAPVSNVHLIAIITLNTAAKFLQEGKQIVTVTWTVNPATLHSTNVSLYFIQATGCNGMARKQATIQA